jgi:hypothetical protein
MTIVKGANSLSNSNCYSRSYENHLLNILTTYIHTYHSHFIAEGVAEVSQIFLRDTHILPKLVSYEEHCRRVGMPIAVLLQPIS